MVIYFLISLVLLVFLYFFTVIQVANKRSQEIFLQIAQEAKQTGDMDRFVKYQSVAFKKLAQIVDDTYVFQIYQVVAEIGNEYTNQLTVFVLPLKTIDHATTSRDQNDQSRIVLTDIATNSVIYDSGLNPILKEFGMSYTVSQIGFYYYAVELKDDHEILIFLFDYNGTNILEGVISFDFIDFDEKNLGELTLGYTDEENEVLLDLDNHVQPYIIRNIALFLVVSSFIGAMLHLATKKKIS